MPFSETLSEFWDDLTDWLQGIGDKIMVFLKPGAKLIARNGGALLIQLATEAVALAERTGGNGDDKFNAARKHVENGLKAQVPNLAINAVKLAIESAVAALNESKQSDPGLPPSEKVV